VQAGRPVVSPATIGPYYNCKGQYSGMFPVHNDEGAGKGNYSLYTGTTQSVNVFFADLEKKVGLCNVVKTAVSMGVHRADGRSLLKAIGKPYHAGYQESADSIPSFTLGSVNVSPMSMAAAYATVAGRGIYCKPVAIERITAPGGKDLPIESAGCHRVFSAAVADAASHILQGVIASGTAVGRSIGRPAAAKTGTANSGTYAAFGGYTPTLAGYVSVFNPLNPTSPAGEMIGAHSCYREVSGALSCPGQMFGDLAGALFEPKALARAETAGRLPARISYSGGPRSLPGVTVTASDDGTAAGYLTAAGARAFGSALTRQFAADHARASYGHDGIFRGVEISLASHLDAVTARPCGSGGEHGQV
jgi:membrane peptidoglycan carboxypeptidase